ncbi:heme-binding protein 2-like [Eriocheir sinensis]|uniref:heme-binding protein 2-like n=1 Tax=Eriocheir sinensis TaxID=95602 RepID=UPI0021CA51BD|nr:heme-binding protein 2-like [Eriocheir sinensis]
MKMRGAGVLAAAVLVVAWAEVCTAYPRDMTEKGQEQFAVKEMAPHKVVSAGVDYEVREYEAAAWACTEQEGSTQMKEKLMKMFVALAQYLQGENSLGVDLKMAGPVTTYKEKSQEGGLRMQMCFYVPSEHQANPPEPTVEGVTVIRKGKMKVAARAFVAVEKSMEEWEAGKLALQKALTDDGVKNINFDNYYGAMYKPPGMKERVTEVWYEMKE